MRSSLWDRIPDDLWHPFSDKLLWLLSGSFQIGFSLSFLAGWNFHFPSTTEQVLWRFATAYHCIFSLFGGAYILYSEIDFQKTGGHSKIVETELAEVPRLRDSDDTESRPATVESVSLRSGRAHKLRNNLYRSVESFRNISTDQDPELKVRLRSAWSIMGLTVIYVLCRLFIYVEDFISIRSQPQGVYITVNRFMPI